MAGLIIIIIIRNADKLDSSNALKVTHHAIIGRTRRIRAKRHLQDVVREMFNQALGGKTAGRIRARHKKNIGGGGDIGGQGLKDSQPARIGGNDIKIPRKEVGLECLAGRDVGYVWTADRRADDRSDIGRQNLNAGVGRGRKGNHISKSIYKIGQSIHDIGRNTGDHNARDKRLERGGIKRQIGNTGRNGVG